MGLVRELVQRADSWVNAMTGLGTLRDKLMHAQVVPGAKLADTTLESLFNDDDVARRVVAKLPREATRRGFKIVLEADDEGTDDEDESADVEREMLDRFQKLDAMPKLRDGWIWARLYGGGSGVFVGAEDGRPVDQPLNEAGIRTVSFLNVLKRPQLSIKQRYEDVQAPKYGEPEIYTVNQAAAALAPKNGIDIHESRLILFDGALTARMTMDSPTGFDDSVLQAAMTTLQQTATAWQSVAHLMTDASQGVLKIANLVDMVAADGAETLRARVQLMDLARSVCRAILIDAEKESFERVATSFAGLPEVMDKLMMRMSAAAEQPVTLLYGRSPAGMNATGESDIRGWYDTVAEGQSDEFKPRLERLLRLMFAAKDGPTRGRVPEYWCIEFNPLWQPTDKEAADTKKVTADTYVALVGAQIMTDAEAGLGLAADFPTIDVDSRQELADADAEEGLRPREVNTPPVLPEDAGPDGGGEGGGGTGGGPKGRTDSGREDAQQRVPAGSPRGGQWTSSGGGGGVAPLPAGSGTLTETERRSIRTSVASGKNAAVSALQAKLVKRYGVPIQKAALMYERDIKAQLTAAKGERARMRTQQREAQGKVDDALKRSTEAMRTAVAAKNAADAARAAAGKRPPPDAKKVAERAERAAARKKKMAEEKAKRVAERARIRAEQKAEAATRTKAENAAAAKAAKEAKAAEKAKAKAKAAGEAITPDDVTAAIAKNGGNLQYGLEAMTSVVKNYLGVQVRPAPNNSIAAENLKSKGWAGYNSDGNIVIDRRRFEVLKNPPARTDVEALEAEYKELNRQVYAAPSQTKARAEAKLKVAKAVTALDAARDYRESMHVLVHEEFHSFGPLYTKGLRYGESRYHGVGKNAEEVTTEVLSRDVMYGAKASSHFGAYQGAVNDVVGAMTAAQKTKRTQAEVFEVLVKASKTYKRTANSADLMDTLHTSIVQHAPDMDSHKLRADLRSVRQL